MEKYIKLKDIDELIEKLIREPAYQHEGEDFYSGVSTVDVEISSLPYIELVEPTFEVESVSAGTKL